MKNVTAVNGNYFKQAVELMNANELYSVKIQLGEELKDSTLKVFMDNVEAVPVEKEEEIVEKIVEMYNFIFDDEYQIPEGIFEEESEMEEVAEEVRVGGTVEVKVKKEKKVKEPKAPKEPKALKEKNGQTSLGKTELFMKELFDKGSTDEEVLAALTQRYVEKAARSKKPQYDEAFILRRFKIYKNILSKTK
jgi:hypothetical protein